MSVFVVTDWMLLDPFPDLPAEHSEDQILMWFKSCKSKGVASQWTVYIETNIVLGQAGISMCFYLPWLCCHCSGFLWSQWTNKNSLDFVSKCNCTRKIHFSQMRNGKHLISDVTLFLEIVLELIFMWSYLIPDIHGLLRGDPQWKCFFKHLSSHEDCKMCWLQMWVSSPEL